MGWTTHSKKVEAFESLAGDDSHHLHLTEECYLSGCQSRWEGERHTEADQYQGIRISLYQEMHASKFKASGDGRDRAGLANVASGRQDSTNTSRIISI